MFKNKIYTVKLNMYCTLQIFLKYSTAYTLKRFANSYYQNNLRSPNQTFCNKTITIWEIKM